MGTKNTGEYIEVINPLGYVNNREITNLPGHYLVAGSKNTRIVNQEKVVASKRYELFGATSDVKNPIVGSFDWKTNTKVYRNIRSYIGTKAELEVWHDSAWRRFMHGYDSARFVWAPYWMATELIDVLIGVNGTDKLFMWTGGIAKVKSVTATTITKTGYYQQANLSFNKANRTVVDPDSAFLTYGFAAGDEITISGSATNDGEYTISTVTADTITLIGTDVLGQTEVDTGNVIVKWTKEGTWAESRFLVNASGRKVRIGDYVFTYSGGENTGTITVTDEDPVALGITAGDYVFQNIVESEPSELDGMSLDMVAVLNNQLYTASERDRRVMISSNTDYTDFTYTSPLRVPGEGFVLTLDAAPTSLVPDEDDMYVSAGDDDWYRVYTEFTDDQGGESVIVRKLKTAPGQASVSHSSVEHIKNGIAFLSAEKVVDTISNIERVENKQNVTISDDIKNDLDNYDVTDAHFRYWSRSLFIALPAESLVLEYDMRFGHWQPPQELPVQRLAIIDGHLCGHSNNSNETYKLYTGYNDNGAPFKAVAAFGYENYGARFWEKQFDELATEAYLSRNTVLTNRVLYDYRGATDIREFTIDGSDDAISFVPADSAGIGKNKLGDAPLGSSADDITDLVKVRAIDTTSQVNFFERQRVFEAEGEDIRFEIIAFGENTRKADNEPVFIKR